ncbi:hypothetical protein GCM10023191_024870 [Actinoallomurus oryzae]|uniref:Protein glutaminase domain-containing protein n=1 Tax=Actinoallomurus oryzae TaxID=502180 RepID=A0ABP8PRR9_9ACTN
MSAKVYPDPEIPPGLRWIVELICATSFPAYSISTGAKLEDDFTAFAATVRETLPKDILNAIGGVNSAGAGAWVDYFTQAMRKQFLSGEGPLEELSTNALDIGKMLGDTNGKVSFTKILLLAQAAELFIELVVAAILAYFTGGASEAAAEENVAEAQAFWRVLLKWLVDNVGRPVAISTAMAEGLAITADLASGRGVNGEDLLEMGIGGAAGGAIFGIGDVMVRNLVNRFVTDVKSVLQNDLKHIFDDLPPGAFGEGSSPGDGFSGDLAGLVADHAPNLTSMGDHPPPALKPEKVDALANGYGDLFAKHFADLVDSDGNRLGSDAAKAIGSDFGKKIALNLADLEKANIPPLLTDAFKNHTAYFSAPLRDALTRRYPIAITRSLDEARHSLRRYATQGLGNAASDFVNGVFSSFVQTAIFDPENMSFDWKTGLLNIGAGATARYLPPMAARYIRRLGLTPTLPDIAMGPPREGSGDALREPGGGAHTATRPPSVLTTHGENSPFTDASSRTHVDVPDVDAVSVATLQAEHIGEVLQGAGQKGKEAARFDTAALSRPIEEGKAAHSGAARASDSRTARPATSPVAGSRPAARSEGTAGRTAASVQPLAAPSRPTVPGPPRHSPPSAAGPTVHSGASTPHDLGWLRLRPEEVSSEKAVELALDLAKMPPRDREAVPALMRPWERVRLATDQGFVETLRRTLLGHAGAGTPERAKALGEFVAVATNLMIDIPPGIERPIAARSAMHRVLKVVLQNPDVAQTLLLKGQRFLPVPKHQTLTSLPEFNAFDGKFTSGGSPYNHVRGLHYGLITGISEENLFGEFSSVMVPKAEGKDTTVHEVAHSLHEHVLSDEQKEDVRAAYREMLVSGEGPNGPRYNAIGMESYAFTNEYEMFAEGFAAWVGGHAGNDLITGLPHNDRKWIRRNMPKLVPIFESLLPGEVKFSAPLNPRESARAENNVFLGLRAFWDRVDSSGGAESAAHVGASPGVRTDEHLYVNDDPDEKWVGVIYSYDDDHILRPDRWGAVSRNEHFQWMNDPVNGPIAVAHMLPSQAAGSARVVGDGLSRFEVEMAVEAARSENYQTVLLEASFAEHSLRDTGQWLQREIADRYGITIVRPRGRVALTSEGPGGILHLDADPNDGEPAGWEMIRPRGNGPVRVETHIIRGPIRRWEEQYPSPDQWLAPFEGPPADWAHEPGSVPPPGGSTAQPPGHGVPPYSAQHAATGPVPGGPAHPAPAAPTVPAQDEILPAEAIGGRPPGDGSGPAERALIREVYGTAAPGAGAARALRQTVRIAREEYLLADVRNGADLAPVLNGVFGADHDWSAGEFVDLVGRAMAGLGREVSAHDLFRWSEAERLLYDLQEDAAIPEALTVSARHVFDLVGLLREGWPVAAERLDGPVGVDDLLPLVRETLDPAADRVTTDHLRVLLRTAQVIDGYGHRLTVAALEQHAWQPDAGGRWSGRSRLAFARRLVSADRHLTPEEADGKLRQAYADAKPWQTYARMRGKLVRRNPATPMADAIADAVVLQHLVDGRVDLARSGRLRELHVLGDLIRQTRGDEDVRSPLTRHDVETFVGRVLGPDAAGDLPEKVSATVGLAGHQVLPVQAVVRRGAFDRLAKAHGIGIREQAKARAVLGFPPRLGSGRATELLALQAQVYGRVDPGRTDQLLGLYRLADLVHSLDQRASREGPLGLESFDRLKPALGSAAGDDRAANIRALAGVAPDAELTPRGRPTLSALWRAYWISRRPSEIPVMTEIRRDALETEQQAAMQRLFGEEISDPVDLAEGPEETFHGLEAVVALVPGEYADVVAGEPRDGKPLPDVQRAHLLPVVRRTLDPQATEVTLQHAKDLAQAARDLRAQGREVTLTNLEGRLTPDRDRNTWARSLIEQAAGRVSTAGRQPRTLQIGVRRIDLSFKASKRLTLRTATPDALALQHLLDGKLALGRRGRIAELYLLGRLLRDGTQDRTGPLPPLQVGDVHRMAADVLGAGAPGKNTDAAAELIKLIRKAGTPTVAAVKAARAMESVPSADPWRRFTMVGWKGLVPGGARRVRDVSALHRELNMNVLVSSSVEMTTSSPAEPAVARSEAVAVVQSEGSAAVQSEAVAVARPEGSAVGRSEGPAVGRSAEVSAASAAGRTAIPYAALGALVDALRVSEPGVRPHGDPVRLGDFERLSQEVLRRPATVESVRELAGLAGKAAKRGPVTPAAMRTVAAFDALRTELGREDLGELDAQVQGLRRDLPDVAAAIRAGDADPFEQVIDAIGHLYRGKVARLEGPIRLPLLRRLVEDVTGEAEITAHAVTEIGTRWRELRSAGGPRTLSRLRASYTPAPRTAPVDHPEPAREGRVTRYNRRLRVWVAAAERAVAPLAWTKREQDHVPDTDPGTTAPVRQRDLAEVRQLLIDEGWNRAVRLTDDGSVPADAEKLTVVGLAHDVYDGFPEGVEEVVESGSRPWSRGIGALSQIFQKEFADRYRQVEGRLRLDDLAPMLERLAGPEAVDPQQRERIESLIAAASGLTEPTMATLAAAMRERGDPWQQMVTRMAAHTGGDQGKAAKTAALWVRLRRADSALRPEDMARLVEVQERDHPASGQRSPFDLDGLYAPLVRDLLGGAEATHGNLRAVAAQLKAVASSSRELPSRVDLRRAAMESRWNPALPGGDPNRRDPAKVADRNEDIPGLSYYRDMSPEDFDALHQWINDLVPGASISRETLLKALRSGFGGLRDRRARLPVEVDGRKYLIEPSLHAVESPARVGDPEDVKLEKRANMTTDLGPGRTSRKGWAAGPEGRGGPVVGEHGFSLSLTAGGGGSYGREGGNDYQRSVGSYNYMKPADKSYNLVVRAFWAAKINEVETGRWRHEEWRVNGDRKITDVRLYTPKHLGDKATDGNLIELDRDDVAELDLANKHYIVEGTTVIGDLSQSLRTALGDKEYMFWEPEIAAFINQDAFASLVVPAHTAPAAGDWQSLPRLPLRKGKRWLNIALGADAVAAKKFGAPVKNMQFDQLKQLIEKSASGATKKWTFKFITVSKLKLFFGTVADRSRLSLVWTRDRSWSNSHLQTIQRAIRAKDTSQVYALFSDYHPFVSFGDDRTGTVTSLALDPVRGSAQIRLREAEVKGTKLHSLTGEEQQSLADERQKKSSNALRYNTTWWMRGKYGLGHGTPVRLTGIENLYDDIVAGGVKAGLLPRAALGPEGRTPWQHLQTLNPTGDALTVDDRLHRNWKTLVDEIAGKPLIRSIDDLLGTGALTELEAADGTIRPIRTKLVFDTGGEPRASDKYMPIDINIGAHTNTVFHAKAFQKEVMPFEAIGTDYTEGADGRPNPGAERVQTRSRRNTKKISDITSMTVMTYLRSEGDSVLFDRPGRYVWWLDEDEMGTVKGGAHIWYAENLLDGDEATPYRPLDTTAESSLLGKEFAGSAVPTELEELQGKVMAGLGRGHETATRKGMGNSRFRTDVSRIFAAGTDVSIDGRVVGWSAEPVGKPQILKFPKAYAEANREAQVGRTVDQEKRNERISGTGAGHNPDLSSTSEGNFLATKTAGKATAASKSEGRTDGNYRTATNTLDMALVRTAVRHSVTLPNGHVVKHDGEMIAEFWPNKIFADPEWRNKWEDLTGKAEDFAKKVKQPKMDLTPPPAFREGMVGEAGYGSKLGQLKDLGDELQYVARELDGPELAAMVSSAVADAPMAMVEMKDGGWSRKFGVGATEYTLILDARELTEAELGELFLSGGLKSYKRTNHIDGQKDGLLSSSQYQFTGVTPTPLKGAPISVRGYGARQTVDGEIGRVAGNMLVMKGFRPKALAEFEQPALITYTFLKNGKPASYGSVVHKHAAVGEVIEDISYLLPLEGTTLDGKETGRVDIPLNIRPSAMDEIAPVDFRVMKALLRSVENGGGRDVAAASDTNALTREKLGPDFFNLASSKHYDGVTNGGRTVSLPGGVTVRLASLVARRIYASKDGEFENYDHETQTAGNELYKASRNTAGFLIKGTGEKPGIPVKFLGYLGGSHSRWKSASDARGMSSESRIWRRQMRDFFKVLAAFSLELTFPGGRQETVDGLTDIGATTEGALSLGIPQDVLDQALDDRDNLIAQIKEYLKAAATDTEPKAVPPALPEVIAESSRQNDPSTGTDPATRTAPGEEAPEVTSRPPTPGEPRRTEAPSGVRDTWLSAAKTFLKTPLSASLKSVTARKPVAEPGGGRGSRQVLPGGPAGGSRDVGAEPLALGWPIGHEFVVTVPRRGVGGARPGAEDAGSGNGARHWGGRPHVVPDVPAAGTGIAAGKGKGRLERPATLTYYRAVTPERGERSGSRPVELTYRISGDGEVISPDGSADGQALDPGGWVRFGDDFFHPESGAFLRGDNGWLGRVGNADELRAALDDPMLPDFATVPYRLSVDSSALYLTPAAGDGPTVRIALSEAGPAEAFHADRLAALLGESRVDVAAVMRQLRYRRSVGDGRSAESLDEAFGARSSGVSLVGAVRSAVEQGRAPAWLVGRVERYLGLAGVDAASPGRIAVAPGESPASHPRIVEFTRDLHTTIAREDVEGAFTRLELLDGDLRSLWGVRGAYRRLFGASLEQDLRGLWPQQDDAATSDDDTLSAGDPDDGGFSERWDELWPAGAADDLFGGSRPEPVPYEQTAAWYDRLAELDFQHHELGAVRMPYDHVSDGCNVRAHLAAMRLLEWGAPVGKIAVSRLTPEGEPGLGLPSADVPGSLQPTAARWAYHVAPVVWSKTKNGARGWLVVDHAFERGAARGSGDGERPGLLTIGEWLAKIGVDPGNDRNLFVEGPLDDVQVALREEYDKAPSTWEYSEEGPDPLGRAVAVITEARLSGHPMGGSATLADIDASYLGQTDELVEHARAMGELRYARRATRILEELRSERNEGRVTAEEAAGRLTAELSGHSPKYDTLTLYPELGDLLHEVLGDPYHELVAGTLFPEPSDPFADMPVEEVREALARTSLSADVSQAGSPPRPLEESPVPPRWPRWERPPHVASGLLGDRPTAVRTMPGIVSPAQSDPVPRAPIRSGDVYRHGDWPSVRDAYERDFTRLVEADTAVAGAAHRALRRLYTTLIRGMSPDEAAIGFFEDRPETAAGSPAKELERLLGEGFSGSNLKEVLTVYERAVRHHRDALTRMFGEIRYRRNPRGDSWLSEMRARGYSVRDLPPNESEWLFRVYRNLEVAPKDRPLFLQAMMAWGGSIAQPVFDTVLAWRWAGLGEDAPHAVPAEVLNTEAAVLYDWLDRRFIRGGGARPPAGPNPLIPPHRRRFEESDEAGENAFDTRNSPTPELAYVPRTGSNGQGAGDLVQQIDEVLNPH